MPETHATSRTFSSGETEQYAHCVPGILDGRKAAGSEMQKREGGCVTEGSFIIHKVF